MFWVKKLAAASAAVLVAVAAVLGAGLAGDDRPLPPAKPVDPVIQRAAVEQELEAAEKRVAEPEAERKRLADAGTAVPRLVVEIGPGKPSSIVVTGYATGGRVVGRCETDSPELLGTCARRGAADPERAEGPSPQGLGGVPGGPAEGGRGGGLGPQVRPGLRGGRRPRPRPGAARPPAPAAPAKQVGGTFGGIERVRGEDGAARPAIIVSLDAGGGSQARFTLAGDAYANRERPGSPRLTWADLELPPPAR